MQLSQRGQRAVNQPLRADLETFYEAMDNRYDAQDNPDGCFTLCIAENGLLWPRLRDKFAEIQRKQTVPEWVPSYTAIRGAPELREAAAAFLSEFVAGDGTAFDPENLTVAAGAAAGIEMSAILLGDPGDVVVIPGPAYMAYTPDIGNIARLERYDLHPATASSAGAAPAAAPTVSPLHEITVADLERAYTELGDRFRMLLLTQPNNPTGQVYAPEQLTAFVDWCEAHKIHLVVNEIYALSLVDWSHADLRAVRLDGDEGLRAARLPLATAKQPSGTNGQIRFHSFLPELEKRQSPYLHWWYSFSKDFGISGMRLGLFYSHNEGLLKGWSNYGSTSMSSNHSQWLLQQTLLDSAWVKDYIIANQAALTKSFAVVATTLTKHEIVFAPAVGSLFVWFKLSHLLTADSDEAELDLWQRIYDETGILLTSPVGQGSRERGWFRLVYSCVGLAELRVAMGRLGDWLV